MKKLCSLITLYHKQNSPSMGSRIEDCQPWGTEKCNSGCAILLPRQTFLVIDCEAVTYGTGIPLVTGIPLNANRLPDFENNSPHKIKKTTSVLTLIFTMPRLNERHWQQNAREANIQAALKSYHRSDRPSIKGTTEQFGVPYSTLRGRIRGVQDRVTRHRAMLVLTVFEENFMTRWCEKLDHQGHPQWLKLVKFMAHALVRRRLKEHTLGRHWLTRFLNCNSTVALKLSSCIDRQRARAHDPKIIKNYFQNVSLATLSL